MTLHKATRSCFSVFIGLLLAVPALAQYGGGTTTGTTTGGYTAPKGGYSSATGIAIGAGAAAGVGIAYFALRGRGTLVGCVEPSTDGFKLMNEKDRNTYALVATNVSFNPGERLALDGKKSKDDSGRPVFHVTKLKKDYGACKS